MKPDLPEVVRVTLEIARVLDDLAVRYLVGGSLASSIHGIPRFTQDADLLVDLPESKIEDLVASLEGTFYVDSDRARSAVRRKASFNVVHLATMVRVDLFILGDRSHLRRELERQRQLGLPGAEGNAVPVASAEDIIIEKLLWYRKGGEVSERQWGDAVGVVQVQGAKLDRGYLESAAVELGVADLLARLLIERP